MTLYEVITVEYQADLPLTPQRTLSKLSKLVLRKIPTRKIKFVSVLPGSPVLSQDDAPMPGVPRVRGFCGLSTTIQIHSQPRIP